MNKKRFILNADDFGMSKATNKAILEGYSEGLLKSASLVANGEGFEEAINSVIPQCENLGVGIHLNITEGISLCEDLNLLTDSESSFNNNFLEILTKVYLSKKDDFLAEIEREFRCQIERVLSKTKVTHIDSHQHIHSIPPIFNLVCRLAKEYQINQVRTHFEKFYFVPDIYKYFNKTYFTNLFKTLLLEIFTVFNEATVNSYGLKTNDYIVGLLYDSLMDSLVVSYGAMAVRYKGTVEVIINPRRYEEGTIDNYFKEFLITKNKKLKEKLEQLGYEITNYVEKDL